MLHVFSVVAADCGPRARGAATGTSQTTASQNDLLGTMARSYGTIMPDNCTGASCSGGDKLQWCDLGLALLCLHWVKPVHGAYRRRCIVQSKGRH